MPFAFVPKLDHIGDVVLTTLTDGDVITWNSTTRKWGNEAIPAPAATYLKADGTENLTGNQLVTGTNAIQFGTTTKNISAPTAGNLKVANTVASGILYLESDEIIIQGAAGQPGIDCVDNGEVTPYFQIYDQAGRNVFDTLGTNVLTIGDAAVATTIDGSVNFTGSVTGISGVFTPAFCSFITAEDSTAGTGTVDIWKDSNYPGGTLSYGTYATAQGITYTPSDGRFTIAAAGTYIVHSMLNLSHAGAAGNVLHNIKVDGVNHHTKEIYVTPVGAATVSPVIVLVTVTASQYLNFEIDSQDANNASAISGTSISIHRIA